MTILFRETFWIIKLYPIVTDEGGGGGCATSAGEKFHTFGIHNLQMGVVITTH